MSYFVFGQIVHLEPIDSTQSLLTSYIPKSLDTADLSIAFGEDITVPVVRGMMNEQKLETYKSHHSIEFFAKRSITHDTSDYLISPNAADFGSQDPTLDATKGATLLFDSLSQLVNTLVSNVLLRVLITEGYDSEFETMPYSLDDAKSHLIRCITEEYSIPSLEYRIVLRQQ